MFSHIAPACAMGGMLAALVSKVHPAPAGLTAIVHLAAWWRWLRPLPVQGRTLPPRPAATGLKTAAAPASQPCKDAHAVPCRPYKAKQSCMLSCI